MFNKDLVRNLGPQGRRVWEKGVPPNPINLKGALALKDFGC